MMARKKYGVIFDLDGVLIDSSYVMKVAFEYAFKQFFPSKDAPFNEYVKHSGKGFSAIMDEMNLPRELAPYFSEKSIELIPKINVFSGVKTLLKDLQENNIYLGVATGKDKHRTQLILEQKELLSYFDQVICSDEVKRGKPYPDSMYWHMDKSGLSGDHLVFIGDSISDIQCAHNSKVTSIAVLWGFGKRGDLLKEKPDYIAYELEDLEDFFIRSGLLNYEKAN